MRIGIDARFFGAKDKGFGRYTENLVKNLEIISSPNSGDEFFVFLKKARWDDYQPKSPNFHKVLADYRWYGLKEQILFPIKLGKYKLDFVHFTHFNVPILYRKKFIVTIHDLILRYFPTRKGIKFLAYRLVFKHAVSHAEKIIAVSNYTKQDILRHYRVSENKIQVIYEGFS